MINVPWTVDINGVTVHCGLSWFLNTWSGAIALVVSVVGGIAAAVMANRREP